MKKTVLLLGILIISACSNQEKKSQENKVPEAKKQIAVKKIFRNDREKMNLKGPVKYTKKITYNMNLGKKKPNIQEIKEYAFDSLGRIVEYNVEYPEGKVVQKTKKIYEDTLLVKEILSDKNNKPFQTIEYKYDNGKLTEKKHLLLPTNKIVSKEVYRYDGNKKTAEFYTKKEGVLQQISYIVSEMSDGNIIKETKFSPKGDTVYTVYYKYDDAGNIINLKNISGTGKKFLEIKYQYDTLGNRILEVLDNPPSNSVRETKYYYNSNQDLVKKQVIQHYSNRNDTTTYEYEYKYDKNNNWIEKLESRNGKPWAKSQRTIEYYPVIQ